MSLRWDRNILGRWPSLALAAAVVAAATFVPLEAQSLPALTEAARKSPTPRAKAALEAYANSRKDENGGLAALALANAARGSKDTQTALAQARTAEKRVPQLADYAAFERAFAFRDNQDWEGCLAEARKVLALRSPQSPLTLRAMVLAVQAATELGRAPEAITLVRQYSDRLPAGRADFLLAKAYEANKELVTAANHYQRVFYLYPQMENAAEAGEALERLRMQLGAGYPQETSAEVLARAAALYRASQARQAQRELEAHLNRYSGQEADLIRVRYLGGDYHLKNDRQAYQALSGLTNLQAEADAERSYYLVQLARRLENDEEIRRSLERLNRYPASRWRLDALVAAGNYYMLADRWSDAKQYYQACADGFPKDNQAAYCHWKVTWQQYLENPASALPQLRTHVANWPDQEKAAAALYFLGRIAEGQSQGAAGAAYYRECARRFPQMYYGVLSRERARQLANAPASPAAEEAALFIKSVKFTDRQAKLNFNADETSRRRLERARLLTAAGFDDWADDELRYGATWDEQKNVMALELSQRLHQRGLPDQGIRTIKRYFPGYLSLPFESAPAEFWRAAFPMPFRESLERYASERDLDPFLVAALVRQESEFNPKALSRVNAHGLTQVMPATGRELGRRLGIKRFQSNMLFVPDLNLRMGTFYLKALRDSLDGRWEATLAAYNAGKSRAVRWLGVRDWRDSVEYAESIPFTETRDYVQIIMRNADIYRRLYGGRTMSAR